MKTITSSPLSILMVSHNYRPYSGGVVHALDALCLGLEKEGHRVTLATLDFGTKEIDPEYVVRLRCPFKFTYRSKLCAVPLFPVAQLRALIREHNIDVVHVHHPFFLSQSALEAARLEGVPVIFTHHTLYTAYMHYVPGACFMPVHKFIVQQVKRFCNQVDHIIAPSLYVKTMLEAQGVQRPIMVLPSPLQEQFFLRAVSSKVMSKKIRLLSVCRFEKEKNLFALMDLWSLLDHTQFEFELIGFGTQLNELQKYAAQKNIEVIFTIKPSREYIIAAYRAATLFVYTSQSETQGLVLAEALACGTPVVALHGPAIDETVEHRKTGFVCDSLECMRACILRLVNEKALYDEFSYNALASSERYSAEVSSNALVSCYKHTISNDSRL